MCDCNISKRVKVQGVWKLLQGTLVEVPLHRVALTRLNLDKNMKKPTGSDNNIVIVETWKMIVHSAVSVYGRHLEVLYGKKQKHLINSCRRHLLVKGMRKRKTESSQSARERGLLFFLFLIRVEPGLGIVVLLSLVHQNTNQDLADRMIWHLFFSISMPRPFFFSLHHTNIPQIPLLSNAVLVFTRITFINIVHCEVTAVLRRTPPHRPPESPS